MIKPNLGPTAAVCCTDLGFCQSRQTLARYPTDLSVSTFLGQQMSFDRRRWPINLFRPEVGEVIFYTLNPVNPALVTTLVSAKRIRTGRASIELKTVTSSGIIILKIFTRRSQWKRLVFVKRGRARTGKKWNGERSEQSDNNIICADGRRTQSVRVVLNRLFSFYFTDLVGSAGKDERPSGYHGGGAHKRKFAHDYEK